MKGKTCTVLARGSMNSCLVQFSDGYKMITSRNALAKVKTHDDLRGHDQETNRR